MPWTCSGFTIALSHKSSFLERLKNKPFRILLVCGKGKEQWYNHLIPINLSVRDVTLCCNSQSKSYGQIQTGSRGDYSPFHGQAMNQPRCYKKFRSQNEDQSLRTEEVSIVRNTLGMRCICLQNYREKKEKHTDLE